MADNRRDRSSYASDDNWDKNQGRYVDDNNYSQQSNYNSNMDLDRDRTIGDTGNYYGGTNYMGASSLNYNDNQDWDNQNRGQQHDRNYQEYQGYGYQSKNDYNQNYQQYGNTSNQYQRNQQNYNRNAGNRGRQDYNQQYNDYDDRRQWQGDRYRTSNQQRNEEHPGYYGHVAGFGSYQNDNYNRQNYRSDYDNRNRGWSDYESRRGQDYRNTSRNFDRNRNDERTWWDKTRDEVSSWFGDEDAERRRRQDEIREAGHKGKGPKEYRRSDERIREDVCDRLSEDSYIDASNVEVRVLNGEVTLDGTIDNRNAKRRAEDIIESISGVSNVQNNLRVGQSMPAGSTTSKGTSIDVSNKRTDSAL